MRCLTLSLWGVRQGTRECPYNAHYASYYNAHTMPKKKQKEFEAYPPRKITVSPEVWDRLKTAKLNSQKTWTNFLKDLLEKL